MHVRVGCEFRYRAPAPTPTIWQVRPRPEGPHWLLSHSWSTTPALPVSTYLDVYGNVCDRLRLVEGENLLRYDALVDVPDGVDDADKDASQHLIEDLPNEALVYLLPSRFCLSDLLHDQAWDLFGSTTPGWSRAQGVVDWVHENVTFQPGASTPTTTAVDVWEKRVGVCRDFAQLGLTFCRSLNIPARYVFGYLPDIGVEPTHEPMDFCAWFEAYLGDRWYTFDPRNNVPRTGRVVIGRGRDALDVAMVTSYGGAALETMQVWADEA
ncbi:MAG: transglutaminase-like domain-containing protein [Acidimicrobiales bacterium]